MLPIFVMLLGGLYWVWSNGFINFDAMFGRQPAAAAPIALPIPAPMPAPVPRVSAPRTETSASTSTAVSRGAVRVPFLRDGGMLKVPVEINGALTLAFMLDSGAGDVAIPQDVASSLIRAGAIQQTDLGGPHNMTLADGSQVRFGRVFIRKLRLGGVTVENVEGSITPEKGVPLLGQTFLGRFRAWSIDNDGSVLVLTPKVDQR